MKTNNRIILFLVTTFIILIFVKIYYYDYSPAEILPETGFNVRLEMEVDGHGPEINVKVTLPQDNGRQKIFDRKAESGVFNFSTFYRDQNQIGYWQNNQVRGHQQISYSFKVKSKKVQFHLPENGIIPPSFPKGFDKYLKREALIQVNDPRIMKKMQQLNLNKNSDIIEAVHNVYIYISGSIKNTGFSGKTDAITTMNLSEASCNGKSRLFVTMLRSIGIPARLVGGMILYAGQKRISHQWAEAYIGNTWVTFDPTNNHYAELPENYLIFYYGDEPLFVRTRNVNFRYYFDIERDEFPREGDYSSLASHPLNIMNAWNLFKKAGLSMELLRIILMIPIGAIVTIIFRNVIGLRTFGTFLPVLIASAFRGSGLLWGMITFISIILLGALIRQLLDRLKITHTPKLTVLLVFVVFSLLTVSAMGVNFHNMKLARATLFPLALMAITIERFALIAQESGTGEALKIFANTAITVIFSYFVINSLFLQTFVMAFPETMLLVIAAGIYFGNWVGLRITELIRFRGLLFGKEGEING